MGRFLSTDPIGYQDSMNLYQYCGNNPVNFVDPWGLDTISRGIGGSAAFGWGVTGEIGFTKDDQGNWGVYGTWGGGAGTPSASGGFVTTRTNAKTIYDTEGVGAQIGGSGTLGINVGMEAVVGNGYSGVQGIVGVGTPIPETHGVVTKTKMFLDQDKVDSMIMNLLEKFGFNNPYSSKDCPKKE